MFRIRQRNEGYIIQAGHHGGPMHDVAECYDEVDLIGTIEWLRSEGFITQGIHDHLLYTFLHQHPQEGSPE